MQYQLKVFVLLLMECFVFSLGQYADMFPCSNNETRNGSVYFAMYEQMSICCQIKGTDCNITSSDGFMLVPQIESKCPESCIAEKMSRPEKCLVKFEVNNATSEDEGKYICKLNGYVYLVRDVHIIQKPAKPSIISFSCTQNRNLTVMFDRGIPSKMYNDLYRVTMNKTNSVTILCDYFLCPKSQTKCTCNNDRSSVRPTDKVTITVTVQRTVVSSWSSKDYNISAVILPGPVKRLDVKDIGLNDANVQFCIHENLLAFLKWMYMKGAPLHFHLLVFKKQGIPEILNVTIPTVVVTIFKCVRIHLHNLTEYTNYTVIVFSSGGGGESQRSKKEFTTNQTVPKHPPLTDGFSFSKIEKIDDVACTLMSALIFMWKPLPFAAQRGRDFSYYIEVELENGLRYSKTIQETYIVFLNGVNETIQEPNVVVLNNKLPQDRLSVKIWAQNALGRSANYTTLEIPSESENEQNLQKLMETKPETMDIPIGESKSNCEIKLEDTTKLNTVVEINGDKAVVHVDSTFLKVDTLLAIHWCSKSTDVIQNGPSICQEYPQTKEYTIIANTHYPQEFEIDISKADEQREMLTYRMLNYCELVYLNSTPIAKKTVNATVTTSPAGIDVSHAATDYDFYDYESDPLGDNLYYNVTYNVNERSRRDADASNKASIKVFISLKSEDSSWNSGMVPVDCYFDRTKGTDVLVVSSFTDKSNMSVFLRWNEECNSNTATIFMAKYFMVYSSTDEKCDDNDHFIQQVDNNIFQPKILKLPKDVKFVCIKSCRIDNVCYFRPSATPVNELQGDADNTTQYVNIPAVVMVPLCIVIIIVIFIVIYCFGRRGRQVKKKLESLKKPQFPTEPNKIDQDACLNQQRTKEPPVKTFLHSISVLSVDSGTGTAFCEDDSRSQKNNSSSSEFHSEERSSSGNVDGKDDRGSSVEPEKVQEEALKKIGNGWTFVKRNSENSKSFNSHGIIPRDSGHGTGLGTTDSRNQKNKDISSEFQCLENSETEDSYDTEGSDESDTEDESKGDTQTSAEFEEEQQQAVEMKDFVTKVARENSQCLESTEKCNLSIEGDMGLFRNGSRSRKNKNISPERHRVEMTRLKESINNDESTVDYSDSDCEIVTEKCDSERCVESETEQVKALKNRGFSFKRRNSGILQQSLDSSQANAAGSECDLFTDCKIDNSGRNLDDGKSIHKSSLHDHSILNVPALSTSSYNRLFSSESESDGDCEKALMSLKYHDHIC